ncbi:MAG TPA: hypothetical protein VK742_03175 [Candidatus Sulfotelmatobacter sp.]|nr:hypothetical protein [Candidatus Sulfotelmatobacter sp.]
MKMRKVKPALICLLEFVFLTCFTIPAFSQAVIHQDSEHKLVTLSDGQGQLALRLNYDGRCVLDQVIVRGRETVGDSAVYTGVRQAGRWFTTTKITTPVVSAGKDTVTVTGIQFGSAGTEIRETWRFTVKQGEIIWRITRKYASDEVLEDTAFPEWNFNDLSTWTGGMLDNGGVIWNKYLDTTNATYGAHFGAVTFWNSSSNDCLQIIPRLPKNQFGAGRFSRQTGNLFAFNYTISPGELKTKYNLKRFLGNRQDLWSPFQVPPSEVNVEFTLKALDYARTYDRGTFAGIDGNQVRDLLNTVARYGVIDERLTGGNGWRSGYICLHEPFFAEIGLALDEDDYITNFSKCLDYERDHAIGDDGRVKSRWCYTAGDAMRGTFDQYGFYEAQWGYLLDSQPDYVINVAEQFDLTGDRTWLAGQKSVCEKALNFLMRREVSHTGLVSMMTDSCGQHRGSDWIDIIWAAHENAFVNAKFYYALEHWVASEEALNDPAGAATYREFAARLKTTFNLPIADGGFWDPTNQWYVYWRDQDGSIHGNNLVTPVNFAAIAYGICDDAGRRKAILDRMETEMQKEQLFSWPLCFFTFQPAEGAKSNFPFPRYENGDLFLSWNELAIRAYAADDPAIALKYVKNILARYAADGLSFQRYLRQTQQGSGNDILAGNCMAVVGLYRDIYGIQPKPDRLYLEPHLTDELNGTKLRYELRGQPYLIDLNTQSCAITAGNCTLRDSPPFSINATAKGLEYYRGGDADWSMSASRPDGQPLTLQIENWTGAPAAARRWTEISEPDKTKTRYIIKNLPSGTTYELKINGQTRESLKVDKAGQIRFTCPHDDSTPQTYELVSSLNNK